MARDIRHDKEQIAELLGDSLMPVSLASRFSSPIADFSSASSSSILASTGASDGQSKPTRAAR